MTGTTIDHMVAITILLIGITLTFGVFNHTLATAFAYARNRQVTIKADDIIDALCLSPGNPSYWGQNSTPLGFGLQDPDSSGYTLSSSSIMRLSPSEENQSPLVYYPKTGEYYTNLTLSSGISLFMQIGDTVNYTTAKELLGITGSYGFQISITPTLMINISQIPADHLILRVNVRGPGLSVEGATLKYFLLQITGGDGTFPKYIQYQGSSLTDASGSAVIHFPSVDDSDDAYSFVTYVKLGGLTGVGHFFHDVLDEYPPFVVPLINNYEQGTVIMAHSWDVHNYTQTPVPAVKYNATFFVRTEGFEWNVMPLANSTGQLNYGEGFPYGTTQVSTSEPGILFITYRWGNRIGSIMVPWGFSPLGNSVTFGGDPSTADFVATELRQIIIDKISFQVKLALWRLG